MLFSTLIEKHFFRVKLPKGGISFGLIGIIGFAIDGSLLSILNLEFSVNIYTARTISFAMATLVTWYLNRTYTFKEVAGDGRTKGEYFRYLIVQICGGLLNFLIFVFVIYIFEWMKLFPVIPLAIGAVFGMIFNYTLSRFWVFNFGFRK